MYGRARKHAVSSPGQKFLHHERSERRSADGRGHAKEPRRLRLGQTQTWYSSILFADAFE
jgi:hypothetical protein